MICLYIEIHNYRQLLRVSPDTLRRVELEVQAVVGASSAEKYPGIDGGRFLYFFAEAEQLMNRPRLSEAVYNVALRCAEALRSESKELYGYKLILENVSEATPEALLQRFQGLMLSIPEEDTLWATPQTLFLFDRRQEAGEVVQHSHRWFCVPRPPNTGSDVQAEAKRRGVDHDTVQEWLLDRLGAALNTRAADRVFAFRCRNVGVLSQELHAAFQYYCGQVDDPPYLKLVGSEEYSSLAFESIRRMLAAVDPEWMERHLTLAGRRIVRELYGNLSERTAFRFGSDLVQVKDYSVMLGLVVDAYRAHAEASGLPLLVVLQEPEHMDRATRSVVQSMIQSLQPSSSGGVEPISVVISGGAFSAVLTWRKPVYSFFVPGYQTSIIVPRIHMLLESVLESEEILRVANGHPNALEQIKQDHSEASKTYDDCSTEVRRLRTEYGNLLCARYVNLRTGIHPRVVAALEWSGRWHEAFRLWNDMFNAAVERGCVSEAADILAGAPLAAHDKPAQSELDLALQAAITRLGALVPQADALRADSNHRGVLRRTLVSRSRNGHIMEANGKEHSISGRTRADLNWILARADRAISVGDSALLKDCAKDALMRAQELGDRNSAGKAQLHLADSLLMLGRVSEAREYASRVRSEAKNTSFGTHEHGLLLEGCAYFIDGNLTRVGDVLEALRERERLLAIPTAFRVLRCVLGYRHALELGRFDSARAELGELRQFLELIGRPDWALSMRYWDALCVLGGGGEVSDSVFEAEGSELSGEMLREHRLFGAAALVWQGRASESLELLNSVPSANGTRGTIFLLRSPRVFSIEEQALGPETVFERMLTTCKALALLQQGRSAVAGELMGGVCKNAARTGVDPYRSLYLFVYSIALSRSKNPDDPDPGAVLGQAVRLLRERTARIENPQEKLEFQRANPINRRLISVARENNLW